MHKLDIVHMPLFGRSLIEASAGTGKTYTISNLLLRLILSPQPQLADKPLRIEQLLVVTFTKAATQELKDRIREKIASAQRYVETGHADDDLLKQLVDAAIAAEDRETIFLRCREASLYLDDAPIFTIHGFCQRVLQEYSFLTGQPFQQTLVENSQDILFELACQVWREKVYALDASAAALVKRRFSDPQGLIKMMAALLDEHLHTDDGAAFPQLAETARDIYQSLQQLWQSEQEPLHALFSQPKLGRSYQANHMPARFSSLELFLTHDSDFLTGWNDKLDYFTQHCIDEKCGVALSHPLFIAMDKLAGLLQQVDAALAAWLRQALLQKLQAFQQEQGILFFDDLVKKLAQALGDNNPGAVQLAERLRQQYPVALIDEFQDTDNWQYQIFQAIYQDQPGQAMLIIGDPKQAIYSFRGADIYTYFQARKDVVEEKRYTLATNWRSQPQLVATVNQLFMCQADAFIQQDFPPYPQMESPPVFADKTGLATTAGLSSLSVLTLDGDEKTALDTSRDQAVEKTAQFIRELLQQPAQLNGKAVKASDIAVLVRKRSQAQLIKDALAWLRINSVYLARDSVLNTEEAQAFLRLLKACANPYSAVAICTALGDSLIAYSAEQIQQLLDGDDFYALQQRFLLAHEKWQKKGFMPMWHELAAHFQLAENCLAQAQGERRLTNLNQLAEIFQQLDKSRLGLPQQLERFQQWIAQASENDEHQKLRLETEADLVEIVTVHASKGLEYPLVCCPFLFDASGGPTQPYHVIYDENTSQRVLHWQLDDSARLQMANNEMAEDVRLLYVALTRAAYHLNICWGRVKGVDKTALWHLLYHRTTPLKNMDAEGVWRPFTALPGCVMNPELVRSHAKATTASVSAPLTLREFERQLQTPYIARSYSALLQTTKHGEVDAAMDKERDTLPYTVAAPVATEFGYNIFHFPKGAEAGNLMHQVLENIDFLADAPELGEEVRRQLQHFGFDDENWVPVLAQHLHTCLRKPLPVAGCALVDLADGQQVKEMDFHLNARALDGKHIARLLSAWRQGGAVPVLHRLDGLFKGFIDLVFEFQGKYYVMDYKSNFLGFSAEDYSPENMQLAIEEHFYDLQYLLYLAALQIYLQQTLPDFDYDTHMGGVYYLFLRGINAVDDAGIFFARPDAKTVSKFAALFDAGVFAPQRSHA